jgi:tetratricopeptide (TPR) repeat protein
VEALQQEYQKQVDQTPAQWAALVVLGRLFRATGNDSRAHELWMRAVAANGDDAPTWLAIGELDRAAGKNADARTAYDNALAHTNANDLKQKALRSLANLALAAGDSDEANNYFRRFLELDPNNAQLWTERGDAMLAAGKREIALESYTAAEKLLGKDPSRRVEIVAKRGQVFEAMGDDDHAEAEYRRAIKLSPRGYFLEVELTDRIIDIYRRKQSLPALVAQYEKDWAVSNRRHFEWHTLGKLYEETGAQDKAIAALKRAVALSAGELDTQRRLIALLENSGRDDEALAQFEAVVRAAPGQQRFQLDLAERYWRRGHLNKALEVLRQIEHRFPNDPGALGAIATLYQTFGRDDLAIAQYERLTRLEPDDAGHLVALGEQYFQRGDKARALRVWTRITASKKPAAYAKLGEVLSEHGAAYYAEAEKNFDLAIAAEPRNVHFHRSRAALYDARKEHKKSLEAWDLVMNLLGTDASDRPARRDARRRVIAALSKLHHVEAERTAKWQAILNTPIAANRGARSEAVEAAYFLVEYFSRPGNAKAGEPLSTLQKLVAMAPDDHDVALDLVKAYRAARKFDEAVALALKLAETAPSREREIYKLISEINTDAHRDDEAIEWQRKALAKSPTDPTAFEGLGERYVAMQKIPEAIAAYDQVLKLDPRNSKAAFALAQLYVQDNTPAKAGEVLRHLLRTANDEDVIRRAGDRAIDLAEMTDTLGELEKVLSPLFFMMAHKPAYRRVLVLLYLRHVTRLANAARSGDEEIKRSSRIELDRIGSRGLRPLLEALRDEADVTQQRIAVQVLGHLGNKAAAAPLVHLAQEPAKDSRHPSTTGEMLNQEVRVAALVAAGRLGDPNVVGAILPLADHAEVAQREAATFALGQSKNRRAVAPLRRALNDRKASVRALACLGLSRVLGPHGTPNKAGIDPTIGPALIAAVREPAPLDIEPGEADLVRAACAYAIGAHRLAAGSDVLVTALNDNRGETRRVAAWALGQLGEPKTLAALVRAYFFRAGAPADELIWAIERASGGASPIPSAAEFSEFPLRGGQFDLAAAVAHLAWVAPPAHSSYVAVQHADVVAAAVIEALGQHHDVVSSALADLHANSGLLSLGALTPPDGDPAAVRALQAIATAIEPAVARHTSAKDASVRALAVGVLATMNRGDTAIATAMSDPEAQVRAAAMFSVAAISRHRGTPPRPLVAALVATLRTRSWEDRRAAALALGQISHSIDVQPLVAAAADESSFVREAVAIALGGVGDPAAMDALRALERDPVPQVQAAAARSLARGSP